MEQRGDITPRIRLEKLTGAIDAKGRGVNRGAEAGGARGSRPPRARNAAHRIQRGGSTQPIVPSLRR